MSASTDASAQVHAARQPTLRALLVRHKLVSLALLVMVLGFAAVVVPEVLSAGKLKITDSTSCSAWSNARPNQWAAYDRLYLRQHRSLPDGSVSPTRVQQAVNYGCLRAYSFDEADTITVLEAIKGEY